MNEQVFRRPLQKNLKRLPCHRKAIGGVFNPLEAPDIAEGEGYLCKIAGKGPRYRAPERIGN
jgi:hypothetical protein